MLQVSNTVKDNIRNCKQEDIANVLIVDNDSELARRMLEILARKGIRGHLADTKDSAINIINKGSCDLVFTNNNLCRPKNFYEQNQEGFELLSVSFLFRTLLSLSSP